jgi:hypothetical protein
VVVVDAPVVLGVVVEELVPTGEPRVVDDDVFGVDVVVVEVEPVVVVVLEVVVVVARGRSVVDGETVEVVVTGGGTTPCVTGIVA